MRITMRHQMSGTRNGQTWPAPGQVVDLPEAEAALLVAQGMASEVEIAAEVETAEVAPDAEVAADVSTPKRRTSK